MKSHGCLAHTAASAGTTRTAAHHRKHRQTVNKVPGCAGTERTLRHITSVAGCSSTRTRVMTMPRQAPPPGQTRISSGIVDHMVQRVGTDRSRVEADTRKEGEAATETMKPRSIQHKMTTRCNHRRVTAEVQRGPTPKSAGFPAAWCSRRERHQWAQVPGVFCERANTAAGRGTRAPALREWRGPNKARARPVDRRRLSGSANSQRTEANVVSDAHPRR